MHCTRPRCFNRHNNDGVTQTVSENLVVLGGLIKGTVSRSYENLRVRVYQGPGDEKGFVQQHVLVARAADGGSMRLEAIIVCAVDKDAKHIVKLDEYFDQKVVDKWVAERVAAATKAKI